MEGSNDLFETFLFSWGQSIVLCRLGIEPSVQKLRRLHISLFLELFRLKWPHSALKIKELTAFT
jgi:hypothetical protein